MPIKLTKFVRGSGQMTLLPQILSHSFYMVYRDYEKKSEPLNPKEFNSPHNPVIFGEYGGWNLKCDDSQYNNIVLKLVFDLDWQEVSPDTVFSGKSLDALVGGKIPPVNPGSDHIWHYHQPKIFATKSAKHIHWVVSAY